MSYTRANTTILCLMLLLWHVLADYSCYDINMHTVFRCGSVVCMSLFACMETLWSILMILWWFLVVLFVPLTLHFFLCYVSLFICSKQMLWRHRVSTRFSFCLHFCFLHIFNQMCNIPLQDMFNEQLNCN